jgi:hypothetical protein
MPGGYHNQAWMTINSSGTGAFSLNAAVSGYNTFANAGVINNEVVPYGAIDTQSNASEQGWGLYTTAGSSTSGPSLTRNVFQSTNSNAAINASSSGTTVFIDEGAADLVQLSLTAHANLGGII